MGKTKSSMISPEQNNSELSSFNKYEIVEDGLRKKYLSRLSELEVAPLTSLIELPNLVDDMIDNIRLYHVTEMVYQKGEQATNKFTTVFNTLATYHDSVFIIIDSDGEKADFYVGVRNNDMDANKKRSAVTLGDTLKNTLVGNFPGIKLEVEDRTKIGSISERILNETSITSISVKGSFKGDKEEKGQQFAQGLESLILAMQGRKYMGIVIAESESPTTIELLRQSDQELYSKLSPLQKVQFSDTLTSSTSRPESFFEMSKERKAAVVGAAMVGVAGAAVGTIVSGGNPLMGAMIGGQIGGQLNGFINQLVPAKNLTEGTSTSTSRHF